MPTTMPTTTTATLMRTTANPMPTAMDSTNPTTTTTQRVLTRATATHHSPTHIATW